MIIYCMYREFNTRTTILSSNYAFNFNIYIFLGVLRLNVRNFTRTASLTTLLQTILQPAYANHYGKAARSQAEAGKVYPNTPTGSHRKAIVCMRAQVGRICAIIPSTHGLTIGKWDCQVNTNVLVLNFYTTI